MNEFTGIWLPAEILAISGLNLTEKVLAAQVVMLSRSGECSAKNPYISNQIKLSETSVSTNLNTLFSKGWIVIEDGKSEGNKRIMYPSLKILNTLFKNLKEGVSHLSPPSLKILKSLFKFFKEAIQDSERGYLRILKSLFKDFKELYIRNESKGESKDEIKDESFIPAESAPEENSNPLDENPSGQTPPPPTPSSEFPTAGDGELRQQCLEYYTDYPDKYPLVMYADFLKYWTRTQPPDGVEKWRLDRNWPLQTRLANWHINYLKDLERQRNGTSRKTNNRTTADFLDRQRAAEPQSIDDYGDL
ncbi:hypothetical protein GO755_29805 [Spirosoma sp. HMF4905]|uniref:Helix-turn-helix domain-containing protein n=1 Tax=Spirosoma arboris TaxID=2682092 RepID=A0A7K1SKM4_9BACT|nr:hypothetical protein [Spirosoma arboris]MVM34263.1 hypothetical protein [Spirosoma arboris]